MSSLCGIYFHYPSSRNRVYLPLISVNATVRVLSTASRTTFTQTFRNPSKESSIDEARYTFPLYADSAVVSFTCKIGDRVIDGVVKPKDTAKAIYEEAKAAGKRAGLLEQNAGDVFTTSLGNIPAGGEVQVVISTISELKHDSEVDGIRLTIPTTVAPRYGSPPSGMGWGAVQHEGMTLKVEVAMPENIRVISSPSHPVTTEMGGWGEGTSNTAEFDPTKAMATLQQTTTTLDSDFILHIRTVTPSSICTPQAILETHPTMPGQQALMTTLVPRFQLPPNSSGKPEVVFIADRSGSMRGNMKPLKSALRVFLKSFPLGGHFNIISFGNQYTKLWPTSKKYSAEALTEALAHIESMSANYGGTEMFAPVEAAIKERLKDINTEVILLTDGEIWNLQPLLDLIRVEREKTKAVRVFTIGVGRAVSHELIEGVARVGGGYCQVVGTEQGVGWENKMVRMLKVALGEHFDDCTLELEFDGEDDEDYDLVDAPVVTPPSDSEQAASAESSNPAAPQTLSLFNPEEKPYQPPETGSSESHPLGAFLDADKSDQFAHLKKLDPPNPLQAPYIIPALIPFERTTVYLLLSKPAKRITAVNLKAKLTSGVEVAQKIPVSVTQKSDTVHKLAARALLRDLTDGRSWISDPKAGGIDKDANPARFGEYVEREGTETAMKWGLASKWTSFVAVEQDAEGQGLAESPGDSGQQYVERNITPSKRSLSSLPGMGLAGKGFSASAPRARKISASGMGRNTARSVTSVASFPVASAASLSVESAASLSVESDGDSDEEMGFGLFDDDISMVDPPPAEKLMSPIYPQKNHSPQRQSQHTEAATLTDEQKVLRIIDLQTFEGSFEDGHAVMQVLGLKGDAAAMAKEAGQSLKVWITAVVVVYLRTKQATHFEMFELVVDKAVDFGKAHVQGKSWEDIEKQAEAWIEV